MFQTLNTNNSGYKLLDKGNNLWQLVTSKGVFTGSLREVCVYAVKSLDFDINEIEFSLQEMERKFHNSAEFGVFKSFIFTYDREEVNANFNISH